MEEDILIKTAQAMVAQHKDLLAMDESNPTCNKRFAALNIPQTPEMHRKYREMIVTTPNLKDGINAAILYDETVHQKLSDGTPFVHALEQAGIIPGIKVDMGAKDMAGFPGEMVTSGLDGLRERLQEYRDMGLRFAKWRAVIAIDKNTPTHRCIENNAIILSRYAALCQEAAIVPIIEPEVLMTGPHDLDVSFKVTENVLHVVFDQLQKQRILSEGIILKPNMVLPGLACEDQSNLKKIASATVTCLLRTVPASVPGVAFLSGGQDAILATQRLNAMHEKFGAQLPWSLAFSFSRALQYPAMELWNGKNENIKKAQQALYHRVMMNAAACRGEYRPEMETS